MDIFILALLAVIAFLLIYAAILEIRLSFSVRPTYVVVPQQVDGGTGSMGIGLLVLVVLALVVAVALLY